MMLPVNQIEKEIAEGEELKMQVAVEVLNMVSKYEEPDGTTTEEKRKQFEHDLLGLLDHNHMSHLQLMEGMVNYMLYLSYTGSQQNVENITKALDCDEEGLKATLNNWKTMEQACWEVTE